jgi:hypothetical protein
VINFSYKSNGNNNSILHYSCAGKNSHTANYRASAKNVTEIHPSATYNEYIQSRGKDKSHQVMEA